MKLSLIGQGKPPRNMLCFRWEAQKSKRYATRAATVMGLILAHLQFNLVLTIRGLHHVHQTP